MPKEFINVVYCNFKIYFQLFIYMYTLHILCNVATVGGRRTSAKGMLTIGFTGNTVFSDNIDLSGVAQENQL